MQRVKHYIIEAPGADPTVIRGTAKKAQTLLRTFHKAGVNATLRCLTNAAERTALLVAN